MKKTTSSQRTPHPQARLPIARGYRRRRRRSAVDSASDDSAPSPDSEPAAGSASPVDSASPDDSSAPDDSASEEPSALEDSSAPDSSAPDSSPLEGSSAPAGSDSPSDSDVFPTQFLATAIALWLAFSSCCFAMESVSDVVISGLLSQIQKHQHTFRKR